MQSVQDAYLVPFAPLMELLRNGLQSVVTPISRLAIQPDFTCVLITLSYRERHRNLLVHRYFYVQYPAHHSVLHHIAHEVKRSCRIGFRRLF